MSAGETENRCSYNSFAEDLTRVRVEVNRCTGSKGSIATEKRAKRLETATRNTCKKNLMKQRLAARDSKAWEECANQESPLSPQVSQAPAVRVASQGWCEETKVKSTEMEKLAKPCAGLRGWCEETKVKPTKMENPAKPCAGVRSESTNNTSMPINPWSCEDDTPEWVLVEDDEEVTDTPSAAVETTTTDDPLLKLRSGGGPLDYCPANLQEFVVPSKAKQRQERWEYL